MVLKRKILLNPGPVTTTRSVKQALVVSDICPREKEFGEVLDEVKNDLVKIVNGKKDYIAVLIAGSGTAAMEASLCSVMPQLKKVLIINNGAYGERFVQIARVFDINYVELRCKSDELPDLQKIEQVLSEDKEICAIAMVHHETTTGILNPLKEVGLLAKKYNCVFIVDAISSFAGILIDITKVNVDFLISSSNKCIQGMPGLSFVICNKAKLAETKNYKRRAFYLDLYEQYRFMEETGQTRFTPPVQVVYALRQAIKEYYKEGGLNRYKRYTKNWQFLRDSLENIGFKFLLKREIESHILTTILYPADKNFNFDRLHDLLYKKGITIYPGKIGDARTFRLANIGDIQTSDIKRFVKELKLALAKMKVNLKRR